MKIIIDSKALEKKKFVDHILAQMQGGLSKSEAIGVTARLFSGSWEPNIDCESRKRSLYRWLQLYEKAGIEGLARKQPEPRETRNLSPEFLAHLADMKGKDADISIPDVIKAAEKLGIIPDGIAKRCSVWRAAKKRNLPLHRCHTANKSDMRRFEFKHRMDMILCDGKHFRAGSKAVKRVAMPMIDDATRSVLVVKVGKTETTHLFLRCLFELVRRFGLPVCIYVDNGSGFVSRDAILVCARLGIHLIHGTEGYPEGHGKIERFHRTMWQQLLRSFRGDPRINANCSELELRCGHYIDHCYNKNKHESIEMAPNEKWAKDARALRFPENMDTLESVFIIERRRKVSKDNIVKMDGKHLDMPIGYSGRVVSVFENTLSNEITFVHDAKTMKLLEVDLEANANAKRSSAKVPPVEKLDARIDTAARIAFEQMYPPVVDDDGNCFK